MVIPLCELKSRAFELPPPYEAPVYLLVGGEEEGSKPFTQKAVPEIPIRYTEEVNSRSSWLATHQVWIHIDSSMSLFTFVL